MNQNSSLRQGLGRRVIFLSATAVGSILILVIMGSITTLLTVHQTLKDNAAKAAYTFDSFLIDMSSSMSVAGKNIAVPATPAERIEMANGVIRNMLQDKPAIFEISMVDLQGNILVSRRRVRLGEPNTTLKTQPWLSAIQDKRIYWSDVSAEEYGTPFVTLAVPVYSDVGEVYGTLVTEIDLAALWGTVTTIRVGDSGYAYLVDESGQLLAYRDLRRVTEGKLQTLIGRSPAEIRSGETNLIPNIYVGLSSQPIVASGMQLTVLPWSIVVEQPLAEALRVFLLSLAFLLTLLFITVALVRGILRFTNRRIIAPLQTLEQGVGEFRAGNLGHRITLSTAENDEISGLGSTFNQMADQLKALIENLEERVNNRTRDLEVAAEVSRQVASALDLNLLLRNVVERTYNGFNLYHVAVFLYDGSSSILDYREGSGEEGKHFKDEGIHLSVNNMAGLIPQAARTRQVVLANDVSTVPEYVISSRLPDTRSELVLPMMVGNRLLGVLDLQSTQCNQFKPDDLRIFTSIAEQAAVAVQNAYLYEQQVKAAEELRAVDTVKSQFLASVSHELRTPLNAILNFTEFVAMGLLGDVNSEQVDALNKVLDSGRHLLALINDVLDITKIQSGMMKLLPETNINLKKDLDAVIDTVPPLLQDKPVKFITEIDENLPLIQGDRRRIRQILLNLLSNAAKFTEEGSITLRVRHLENEIEFAVIDTGPGIDRKDQQRIFEPFQQTETGIRHMSGTGLGLPISKRLAEAHSGKLWLESEPGKGAAFYFSLPLNVPLAEKPAHV